MVDFIDNFMEYTSHIATPKIFRLWGGISALTAAMEKRVYMHFLNDDRLSHANMFIMLVGKPATGKTEIIHPVKKLWASTGELHVAASNLTKPVLIDALATCRKPYGGPGLEGLNTYHTLNVASTEFSVLVPAYDEAFLKALVMMWDNEDIYSEGRRCKVTDTNAKGELVINEPQMNMIAGTQPSYLSSVMPEAAWSQGFMSRTFMIYSKETPTIQYFTKHKSCPVLKKSLEAHMKTLCGMRGEMKWTQNMADACNALLQAGQQPAPTHRKLQGYCGRRNYNLIKLVMVACASRDPQCMKAELCDFERAWGWMREAEAQMPLVFREMETSSDAGILEGLAEYAAEVYQHSKKAIPERTLANYLAARVTHDKIAGILKTAVVIGSMSVDMLGNYIPASGYKGFY